MKVLVTGGSGYLGQFLLVSLTNQQHQVAYTYLTTALDPSSCSATGFRVNLESGEGLAEAALGFRPDVVINCAAVSQPAACEQDYQAARALNRPERLVQALQQLQEQHGKTALLIHLSTDQVYNGSRAWWSESDAANPINAYGRSKLEAESLLQQAWRGKFVSLRSSLIFGPEPPLSPVGRPLFLQFVRQVLQAGKDTTFFVDEYRCAVYVQDICSVVSHIISRARQRQGRCAAAEQADGSSSSGCVLAGLRHSIYNMGGPDRLSRHDIAMAVAHHFSLDRRPVLVAHSADVKRGYDSPLDISMRMDRLLQDMPGVVLTPFAAALRHIFPAEPQAE